MIIYNRFTGAVMHADLTQVLADHKEWRVSNGHRGARAILVGANLARANLVGANLARANPMATPKGPTTRKPRRPQRRKTTRFERHPPP
jgi:hypothetical protein